MIILTDEKMKRQIKLHKEQIKLLKKLENNSTQTRYFKDENMEWRNTRFDFWKAICEKYEDKDLLNCYGDIFFIDRKDRGSFIGRRVLWNLGCSAESYMITPIVEIDSDGGYDFTYYEIEVMKND